jgi:hypothetical protein
VGEIINFAAAVNARLVSAKIAAAEQAAAERLQLRRATIRDEFADAGRSGAIMADVVADVLEAEEKAAAPGWMPAYCDPSNESRGSKYAATRDLSCKDIAARIRADIKDAIKAGRLPAGLKVRCWMPHYGCIEVRVTELPDGFPVLNPKFALWCREHDRPDGDSYDSHWAHAWRDTRSDEVNALLDALGAIHAAYNRDNSDSQSDYFDVRYYGRAEIDGAVTRERARAEKFSQQRS